ncbi:hypothetical protein J8273_0763 [Carpediemonas membranifera]|uniref:Uncharacterized protein n=1 Tax=Carpediemonas membranifera TaxID=201153 RepID=A0A8J6AZ79_9EUKA|nr:hypothetical protein J8273_0763 [Carpediemonas membranifera]|eukprot:KAG9397633.1 hypothetical protein J8273_0763 [Carpediemonas membranifera]
MSSLIEAQKGLSDIQFVEWLNENQVEVFRKLDDDFFPLFRTDEHPMLPRFKSQMAFLRAVRMLVLYVIRTRLDSSAAANVQQFIENDGVYFCLKQISQAILYKPELDAVQSKMINLAEETSVILECGFVAEDLASLAKLRAFFTQCRPMIASLAISWDMIGNSAVMNPPAALEVPVPNAKTTVNEDSEIEEDTDVDRDDMAQVVALQDSETLPNCSWLTVGDYNRCRQYCRDAAANGATYLSRNELVEKDLFRTSRMLKIAPSAAIQGLIHEGLLSKRYSKFGSLINTHRVLHIADGRRDTFPATFPRLTASLQKVQDKRR